LSLVTRAFSTSAKVAELDAFSTATAPDTIAVAGNVPAQPTLETLAGQSARSWHAVHRLHVTSDRKQLDLGAEVCVGRWRGSTNFGSCNANGVAYAGRKQQRHVRVPRRDNWDNASGAQIGERRV